MKATTTTQKAGGKGFNMLRKERQIGGANNLQVFLSQQVYLSALTGSVQAWAAQYADAVALFQALDGGWWNRDDARSPSSDDDSFKFL